MVTHRRNSHSHTSQSSLLKKPIPDTTCTYEDHIVAIYELSVSSSCWPPIGICHSCGFGEYRRVGTVYIARDKSCNNCGTPSHIEKACKRRQNANAAKSMERIGEKPSILPPILHAQGEEIPVQTNKAAQCQKITVSETDQDPSNPAQPNKRAQCPKISVSGTDQTNHHIGTQPEHVDRGKEAQTSPIIILDTGSTEVDDESQNGY